MAHGGELAARRHRARQVRARIVLLAQEYKAASDQHEELARYVLEAKDVPDRLILEHEGRVWDLLQQAREALFWALEELEGVEEEGHGH